MNELLDAFLTEGRELIEQATRDLLALEERPGDKDSLDGAFRAFHTLKGAAGIIEFTAMGRLLHAAEEILEQVRGGGAPLTKETVSQCLACLDQVQNWLEYIEAHGEPPSDATADADKLLRGFAGGGASGGSPTSGLDVGSFLVEEKGLLATAQILLAAQLPLLSDSHSDGALGCRASAATVVANVLRASKRAAEAEHVEQVFAVCLSAGDFNPLRVLVETMVGATETAAPREAETDEPSEAQDTLVRTLRVDVGRVDALIKLVGEMTVVNNAFDYAARLAQTDGDAKALASLLKNQHATLDRLVSELQQSVLRLRLLPLRHAFQRFPRLVRDLAATLGKSVKLIMDGDETEADKVVVENLSDPLLHVVRNAVDHGIEPADQRISVGKPVPATIQLRARREGEHVIVEVEDDGRGIDLARVREIAAARRILPPDKLRSLNEQEALDLIFTPGFTTAAEVTGLSGRGVGMDAVRRAVQKLGGRVTLESLPGQRTCVRFTLPFSVMMTQILTVEAAGQVFGIPLDSVVETIRLAEDRIVAIGGTQAFVARDRTIPLIDLAETLGGVKATLSAPEINVVIVAVGGHFGGLVVDRLGERMEVMLKPIDRLLAGTPGVSGTTLLGDGRVLIVLDTEELLQ